MTAELASHGCVSAAARARRRSTPLPAATMPRRQTSRGAEGEEQRSLRASASDSDDSSGDDGGASRGGGRRYDAGEDHADSVMISDVAMREEAQVYVMQVYTADAQLVWELRKRYSEVDKLRGELTGSKKAWKAEVDSYQFPKKMMSAALEGEALDDRKRLLEQWLNKVLAHAAKVRDKGRGKSKVDAGLKKLDAFFDPAKNSSEVSPVDKAAVVDKADAMMDREDQREHAALESKLKKAAKRDANFKRDNVRKLKEEAVRSPVSPGREDGGDSDSSDSSDDEDDETCRERAQDCVGRCWDMMKRLCGQCVERCNEYRNLKDDDESDESDDEERNRSSRAASSPGRIEGGGREDARKKRSET